ncbi:MAG: hypothetical protein JWL60_935 [Gemmatimonadetes bacterium]|jgi:NhaP-type Na+/H+ or K+/H+ antiporter|nr:hypothetical protein [Gemmatimonadota bacterium]
MRHRPYNPSPEMMPRKLARLAGLGAFGACAGFVAVYALFVFATRPTTTSGLDATQRFLTWFTVAGVVLALVLVHVGIGRQLLRMARDESRGP